MEVAAFPCAAAIMEAQPLMLVLWLAGLVLTGQNALLALDPATILLLLLGLHWWAMGVRQFEQPGSSETRTLMFHLVGLCLALALVIGMHPPLIGQPMDLFLSAILVLWCWQRGIRRTRANRRDEHMKMAFQRAFFVMLALVVLIALFPSIATKLIAPLTLALPLFFLSGLALFSLLRLKTTGLAYQKRFTHDQRADPTRLWSILVTVFWSGMVALAFFVETAAFPLVFVLLAPLLTPLANALRNLNAFLDALLQRKPIAPLIIHKKIILRKLPPPPVPFHNPVLVIILTLIAFGVMGLILVIVIRIWYSNYHYTREDEIREGIAPSAVRKERQQKSASSARDQLDPTSVRAQYRKFLLMMARKGTGLERFPHETPGEYQKRLHSVLESFPCQQQEHFPDAILDELTRAYVQERYAGKRLDDHPSTYWHIHMRVFVKRFRRLARKREHLSIKEVQSKIMMEMAIRGKGHSK
jgi:hypothetical protein